MNSKSLKYSAGCAIMAACWLVAPFSLCESPAPALNKAPAPIASFECEAHAVESELPLPTESEITGIEFALFEPLPAPKKIIRKERSTKKVQNKAGQINGHKVK